MVHWGKGLGFRESGFRVYFGFRVPQIGGGFLVEGSGGRVEG